MKGAFVTPLTGRLRCRRLIFSISKREGFLAAYVALAGIIFGVVGFRNNAALDESRGATRNALQLAHAADSVAGQLASKAHDALLLADAYAARADSLEHRPARIKYLVAKASAPDTCVKIVALADSALATADSAADARRLGAQALGKAVDSTTTALTAVLASQTNLERAATVLVKASKPKRQILPRPGFGLALGINSAGQPQLVFGITLGWSR